MSETESKIWRPPTVDGVHYPPMEVTTLLTRMPNGTIRAKEKMPVPLTEFGYPDLEGIIDTSLETISRDYVIPTRSNRHHLATPARLYVEHSTGSKIPEQYREAKSLLTYIPVQLHNYLHEIFEVPPEPSMDVMVQVVREQTDLDTLADLGKTAISLSKASFVGIKDLVERGERKLVAKREARQLQRLFYDYLYKCPDGEVGILPDTEWLANIQFTQAVRELGNLSSPRGIDSRQEVERRLARVGFAA